MIESLQGTPELAPCPFLYLLLFFKQSSNSCHLFLWVSPSSGLVESRDCLALTSQIPPSFPAAASSALSFSIYRFLSFITLYILSWVCSRRSLRCSLLSEGDNNRLFIRGVKDLRHQALKKNVLTHTQTHTESILMAKPYYSRPSRSLLGTLNTRCFKCPHARYSSYLRLRFILKAFNWSVGSLLSHCEC